MHRYVILGKLLPGAGKYDHGHDCFNSDILQSLSLHDAVTCSLQQSAAVQNITIVTGARVNCVVTSDWMTRSCIEARRHSPDYVVMNSEVPSRVSHWHTGTPASRMLQSAV